MCVRPVRMKVSGFRAVGSPGIRGVMGAGGGE